MNIVDFGGVPKYQDLSFKFQFPTKSAGTFSLFGLGGKSHILEEITVEENEEIIIDLCFSGTFLLWFSKKAGISDISENLSPSCS